MIETHSLRAVPDINAGDVNHAAVSRAIADHDHHVS
jgi:hypothetical protein